MGNYIPKPIDLSDVSISEDLRELREAIAENTHEVWAENRKKQTPDMVPYAQLSEKEKEYDRATAWRTIKLLKKLGYDIVKSKETPLYNELITRVREIEHANHCSQCGGVIFKHQVFCEHCGKKLDKEDFTS